MCYRDGLIRSITHTACYGTALSESIYMDMSTMIGRFTGDVTGMQIMPSVNTCPFSEGTIVKIYETA